MSSHPFINTREEGHEVGSWRRVIIIHLIEEADLTRHVPVKAVIRCKLNCIGIKFNETHVQFYSHVQYTPPPPTNESRCIYTTNSTAHLE